MTRNRTFVAVSIAVCAAYIGIGLVGPVRVLYAQSRGASLAVISAMTSAFLLANFAAQYPSGWLADRWGRKRIMVAGLLAQALLSLAYLFITEPTLFVALRFAEGVAGAAVLPSARALIADTVAPQERGRAYGVFSAAFNAGFLIGPALGGLLATVSYASVFVAAVVCRLVALAVVLVMIPQTAPAGAARSEAGIPARTASHRRDLFRLPLVGAYVLAFGDFLYLGFDLALMPIWMNKHLGASVTVIGLAYVAWAGPSILLSPVGGKVADRTRRSRLILIFGLAQVPLYVIYGLANTGWIVAALFGVHAALYAFVQPAVDAHVAAASSVESRARVQGVYSMVGAVGAFVAANALPPLYALNFRLPLFALGAGYGVCVVTGGLMVRRSETREPAISSLAPEAPQVAAIVE
jgi:DHA1 family tetracycline resistance protein-like MFS transporter